MEHFPVKMVVNYTLKGPDVQPIHLYRTSINQSLVFKG